MLAWDLTRPHGSAQGHQAPMPGNSCRGVAWAIGGAGGRDKGGGVVAGEARTLTRGAATPRGAFKPS